MHTVEPKEVKTETQPYEPPQIIYEGQISTRAGSPLGNPSGVDGIDPGDLFD
jgi:hypothetical protein